MRTAEESPPWMDVWNETVGIQPFCNTFTALLFYVNPVATPEEKTQSIQKIHTDLTTRLRPWVQEYIWDKSPPSVRLCHAHNHDYVFLELELGDTDTDEWLITSILWEMSETYEDLFVRCYDSEGDHLLIEAWEALPEWLEPENARNRAWINHKRIVIVPELFYRSRGLALQEALQFLEKAGYKCTRVAEIDKTLEKKCKEFPNKALEGQIGMQIEVSRRIAGVMMKEKQIVNQAVIEYLKKMSIIGSQQEEKKYELDDPVRITVRTRVESFLMIDVWLKQKQRDVDLIRDGGILVSIAIEGLIERGNLHSSYMPSDEELQDFNEKGDLLQNELLRLMRIDSIVESRLDLRPPDEIDRDTPNFNENEMMEKMERFFRDNDSGLDGVDNDTKNAPERAQSEAKLESIDEDEITDDDSDADSDEEARAFLRAQNIAIDEDDFFEFFAKEALKLSDDDLEKLRTVRVADDEDDEQSAQDGKTSDSKEAELIDDVEAGDVQQSLQELLKSLNTGFDGPAATFLQNMR